MYNKTSISSTSYVLFPYHYFVMCFVLGIFSIISLFPGIICFLLLIFFITINNLPKKIIILCVIFFVTGFFCAHIKKNLSLYKDKVPLNKKIFLKAEVKQVLTYPDNKIYATLKNVTYKYMGKENKINSYVLWKIYNRAIIPLAGQRIAGFFKLKKIRGCLNPGTFNYREIYKLKNIHLVTYTNTFKKNIQLKGEPNFFWKIKYVVKKHLLQAMGNTKNRGILLSLVIGDRSYIKLKNIELLRKSSLSHLIVQSGLHVGFVAFLGFAISYLIGLIYPNLFLMIPRQKLGCLIASFLVICFFIVSETRPSIIRSCIMFFCWVILFLKNNKYFIIDGLFISFILLILSDIFCVFNIGLQLSYLSIFSIILVFLKIDKKLPQNIRSNKILHYIISIILISFIINLILIPIIAYYFGEISLSFYTNIFFIPVIGFIVLPCMLIALIFSMFNLTIYISHFFIMCCDKIVNLCIYILKYLNQFHLIITFPCIRPNSYILIGYYLIFIAIFFTFNKKIYRYILIKVSIIMISTPILISFFNHFRDKLVINILDVGQGQSILIEYKGTRTLIDGGGTWNKNFDFGRIVLSPILTYLHTPTLNNIILTHPDIDHIGGLFYIMKKYRIKNFYYNGFYYRKKRLKYLLKIAKNKKICIHTVWKENIINIDKNLWIEIINPYKKYYKNINNSSLILKLYYYNKPILLVTSDAYSSILKYISKFNIKSNILIVPHHGSKNSFSQEFIKRVKPKIAIISCGYLNRFGFPSKKWMIYLKKHNIKTYNTAVDGCITILIKRYKKEIYEKIKTINKYRGSIKWEKISCNDL